MLDGISTLEQLRNPVHIVRLERDQARGLIRESGLDPIFEQQTPEVPIAGELTTATLELCRNLLVFAQHNQYLKLAGLAANQLGRNGKRLFLNACFIRRDRDWIVAIDPELVSTQGASRSSTEGCLTWRKKKILANRHDGVVVSYSTPDGGRKEERVEGFEAIVWQHEINHLRGVPEHVIDPSRKLRPNDPCYCGSEKKFKRCCGR